MKLIRILLVILFILPAQMGVSQTLEEVLSQDIPVDPKVRIGKLENGMTYYVRQNSRPENRLELKLAIDAGSILESDQQLGLAHFTEHMAFNGTKNFSKNELVDYLQSVGVRFGAHLNAYTSFDETVYMLHLPSDSTEIVNKGFQILEDWAHNLSFEEEEIDKERGVVIEEWRLGQGADRRMLDKYLPVIFKDSRYAERLPIGTKEVLENFDYETLKQFYADWYRPDLMAVIAVGDMDPDLMEEKIKDHFGGIQVNPNPRNRETFPVPDHQETLTSVVSDKEAAFTLIRLYYKTDSKEVKTLNDLRQMLKAGIYTGMLNQRLNELRQKAEPPFLYANTSFGGTWARSKSAFQALAVTSETGVIKGLETLAEENERVRLHGFTQGELDRYKMDLLIGYENAYKEREKTESENYSNEYISHFLEKEPIPGIEFEYNFAKNIIGTITLEEVNELTQKFIHEDNRVVVITAPEKEGVVLPADDQIKQVFADLSAKEIAPYEDKLAGASLMETAPAPGKIISSEELEEIGVTELTLQNGVKVSLKPTDFKNDEIYFQAQSPGGHSIYPDEDYQSAVNTSRIVSESGVSDFSRIDLQKLMAGKIVSVSPYISELTEGLRGNCAPNDMETMFQWIYLQFTSARKDPEIFQSYISKNRDIYKNLMSNPQYYYQDQLTRIMTQDHPRGGRFPEDQDWDKVDLEKVYQIYTDRFKDASDFRFLFVGNFEVEEIKPFIETYLGSLPAQNRVETWKDLGIRPPSGLVDKAVKKGVDPKSRVNLTFTGEAEYDRMEMYRLMVVAEILDIKLIEVLREEKGGVYGVGAGSNLVQYPYPYYRFVIQFPCSPENVESLTEATFGEIAKIQDNGPTPEDLNKVKETLKREREEKLRENSYWLSVLNNYYYNGLDPRETLEYEDRIDSITGKDIQKASRKYLNKESYIRVTLYPEE